MRILASALAFAALAAPAAAKDLPEGTFAVVGDVFPAVNEGLMVPVFAHVTTTADTLEWRFFTGFPATDDMCKNFGKCQTVVQGLTQQVSWDGRLSLNASTHASGEGMTIDRPDIDPITIYGALDEFIDGAMLDMDAGGGTLAQGGRRGNPREVTLIPATLEELRDAVALVKTFEQSLAKLEGCAVRQVLDFGTLSDPTPAQREVLLASRYAGWLDQLEAERGYYFLDEPPESENERIDRLTMQRNAVNIARAMPLQEVAEGMLSDAPLPDDTIIGLSAAALELLETRMAEDYDAMRTEILESRRDELLALIRLSARYAVRMSEGWDPITALCNDITLGG
ncbi:hypothetical protein [Psychromarinibacter sp. S121]|uniref:hypothetical protein n=1 Tax=Psychromarinibacter sp. S121 TaxID=3415127 RepID=UPI003C7C6696